MSDRVFKGGSGGAVDDAAVTAREIELAAETQALFARESALVEAASGTDRAGPDPDQYATVMHLRAAANEARAAANVVWRALLDDWDRAMTPAIAPELRTRLVRALGEVGLDADTVDAAVDAFFGEETPPPLDETVPPWEQAEPEVGLEAPRTPPPAFDDAIALEPTAAMVGDIDSAVAQLVSAEAAGGDDEPARAEPRAMLADSEETADSAEAAEDSLDDSEDSLDDSEDSLDDSEDSLDDSEDSADGSEDSLDGSEDSVDGSEDSVDGSEDSADGSEDSLDDSEDSLDGSEDSLDDSEDSLDGSEDSLDDSEDSLDDSEDSLDEPEAADGSEDAQDGPEAADGAEDAQDEPEADDDAEDSQDEPDDAVAAAGEEPSDPHAAEADDEPTPEDSAELAAALAAHTADDPDAPFAARDGSAAAAADAPIADLDDLDDLDESVDLGADPWADDVPLAADDGTLGGLAQVIAASGRAATPAEIDADDLVVDQIVEHVPPPLPERDPAPPAFDRALDGDSDLETENQVLDDAAQAALDAVLQPSTGSGDQADAPMDEDLVDFGDPLAQPLAGDDVEVEAMVAQLERALDEEPDDESVDDDPWGNVATDTNLAPLGSGEAEISPSQVPQPIASEPAATFEGEPPPTFDVAADASMELPPVEDIDLPSDSLELAPVTGLEPASSVELFDDGASPDASNFEAFDDPADFDDELEEEERASQSPGARAPEQFAEDLLEVPPPLGSEASFGAPLPPDPDAPAQSPVDFLAETGDEDDEEAHELVDEADFGFELELDPVQIEDEEGEEPTVALRSGDPWDEVALGATDGSSGGGERRPDWVERGPRAALAVKVGIQYEGQFFAGFTGSISAGGIFISTHQELPIGAVVDLFFEVPGGYSIATKGEVRWCRQAADEGAGLSRGLGLRFVDLDPSDHSIICRYLDQHATSSARLPVD